MKNALDVFGEEWIWNNGCLELNDAPFLVGHSI